MISSSLKTRDYRDPMVRTQIWHRLGCTVMGQTRSYSPVRPSAFLRWWLAKASWRMPAICHETFIPGLPPGRSGCAGLMGWARSPAYCGSVRRWRY